MKEPLTEAQRMKASLLSPDTIAMLEESVEVLTEGLVTIVFGSDPVERERSILLFVELQARRNILVELLRSSQDAYEAVAQASFQQPGNTAAPATSTF
jgi:hypothetical protein